MHTFDTFFKTFFLSEVGNYVVGNGELREIESTAKVNSNKMSRDINCVDPKRRKTLQLLLLSQACFLVTWPHGARSL
jgi:predicted nucleic acid-binding protein